MHTRVFTMMVLVAACGGSTPGAQPHDMSAAAHESAANEHDQVAQTHAAQFDASVKVATEKCTHNRGDSSICWTSISNPTSAHLEEAARHRKMAADHRAASKALRDAEASACVWISDDDRDDSPFDHKEDITSVEPLRSTIGAPKSQMTRTEGATITFRAVPGMTAQWRSSASSTATSRATRRSDTSCRRCRIARSFPTA